MTRLEARRRSTERTLFARRGIEAKRLVARFGA